MIYSLFLLFYFGSLAYLCIKTKGKILGNEIFWLLAMWVLCFGTYIVVEIDYSTYGISFQFISFFIPCVIAFIIGRKKGLVAPTKIFSSLNTDNIVSKKFLFLGLLGTFLYLFDCIRLNGIYTFLLEEGGRKEIQLSMVGTFGVLLLPLTLLQGLAMFARQLVCYGKFSYKALLILLLFALPSTITGGRESLLYCVIGIISLYGFRSTLISLNLYKPKNKQKNSTNKISYIAAFVAIAFVLWGVYQISTKRFSSNDINYFLYINDVPSSVVEDADRWGNFSFLYYNILSYFGHQIPFLDFTIKEYDGPYMCGFYELNIFARRLGIDYTSVTTHLHKLLVKKHMTTFIGEWNTVLGSLIFDFGRIGSIPICYLCGYMLGKVRRKINNSMDIRYAVLISLFCLSAFSTVQLGPFYQTLIWSTYMWWYIIYHKNETIQI